MKSLSKVCLNRLIWGRLALTLLLCQGIAACTPTGVVGPVRPLVSISSAPSRQEAPSDPAAASADSAPPPTAAELAANPSRFEGLNADAVVTWLGDPSFRRRDAPAEVWQYYGDKCVLDLFLYDENDAQRVAHAEIRSRTADEGNGCLTHMLAGRHS